MQLRPHLAPFFQVDAFTTTPLSGNPAAVVVLAQDNDLPDTILMAIAAENNLPETAFLFPQEQDGAYRLRWFTPSVEVELCGHATLAAAWVVFNHLEPQRTDALTFETRFRGDLRVDRSGSMLAMDLPRVRYTRREHMPDLQAALGVEHVLHFLDGEKPTGVLQTEEEVVSLKPDLHAIAQLDAFGVGVTAPSSIPNIDYVGRFFAPAKSIPEDPVTGSLHAMLGPYWMAQFNASSVRASQRSSRGGYLEVEAAAEADRVLIRGSVVGVIEGRFRLPLPLR